MSIMIKNLDLSSLKEDTRQDDYLLIGDASINFITERTTWACLMVDRACNSELIFGMENQKNDIHAAELLPYVKAMQTLRSRNKKIGRYKLRLHIICDNSNVVAQYGKTAGFHTSGIWKEVLSYEVSHFDLYFEHALRRSNPLMALVDSVCSALQATHGDLDDKVQAVCHRYSSAIRNSDDCVLTAEVLRYADAIKSINSINMKGGV
jgi:hypothetical protein